MTMEHAPRIVLCQDCGSFAAYSDDRHNGKDLCDCGGEYCGCPPCAWVALRAKRLAEHKAAFARLKPILKPGDRIRAQRGECCARLATYTFDGWDGEWIVSKSGVNTIVPRSVVSINGKKFEDD